MWFIWLCNTPACFSTFYQSTSVPTKFLVYYSTLLTFLKIKILYGEPTSKGIKWCRAPQLYQQSSESEVSVAQLCQLCSSCYTAKKNQELYEKYLCSQSSHYEKYKWNHAPINYRHKLSIMLLCKLFSTHYTPIQIKT